MTATKHTPTHKTSHAHKKTDPCAGLSDAAKAITQPFLDGFAKLGGDDRAAILTAITPAMQAEYDSEGDAGI